MLSVSLNNADIESNGRAFCQEVFKPVPISMRLLSLEKYEYTLNALMDICAMVNAHFLIKIYTEIYSQNTYEKSRYIFINLPIRMS